MKKALALVVLTAAGWFFLHEPAARWRGIPAQKDPVQVTFGLPAPFTHEGHTVTPLARYTVTAVVLSRERYRNDREARLSPVDLALGWGPMSIATSINDLKISQSGRWYEYSWSKEPPLDPGQIVTHSANTHCLPADGSVRDQLLAVKRHDLVTLEGFLVEVTAPEGFRWRSSLTRDDTGARACEVMWVTRVSRRTL